MLDHIATVAVRVGLPEDYGIYLHSNLNKRKSDTAITLEFFFILNKNICRLKLLIPLVSDYLMSGVDVLQISIISFFFVTTSLSICVQFISHTCTGATYIWGHPWDSSCPAGL